MTETITLLDDDALEFTKQFHNINQTFKNLPDNLDFYFLDNHEIISFRDNMLFQLKAYILDTKKQKLLYDTIANTRVSIYGKDFFQFHKGHAKLVNKVEVTNNMIKFVSQANSEFKCVLEGNEYREYMEQSRRKKRLDELLKNTEFLLEKELSYETFRMMKGIPTSFNLNLSLDSDEILIDEEHETGTDYSIKLAHKYFTRFLKSTKSSFSVLRDPELEHSYILQVDIETNNNFKSSQYFRFLKIE